jgi:hypothetical protein
MLSRIIKTIPSYCHVRIIFSSNLENEHFPRANTGHFVSLSIFQFKIGLTVHNNQLDNTYKRFYKMNSKHTNCTLNLVTPTSSSSPEFDTNMIQFLHKSIRLLILEPIHWANKTFQDYKFLRLASTHFSLILFPFTMPDDSMLLRNKTLYSSSFRQVDKKYSIDNFGVIFLPKKTDSSDFELCIQNHGLNPTIHNMTCQSVKHFSLIFFTTLGSPSKRWAAYINGHDAYSGMLFKSSISNLRSISSYSRTYEMLLLGEILNYSNVSLVNEDSFPEQKVHVNLDLVATYRFKRPPTFSLVKTDSIHFLTCYSRPILSFQLYVNPFHVSVWLSILFTLSILIIGMNLIFWNSNLPNYTKTVHSVSNMLSPTFYLLSTMLGQSSVKVLPEGLRLSAAFRLAIGLWMLSLVVISNIYLSRVIAELNSAVKNQRLDYYRNVVCPWTEFRKTPCRNACEKETISISSLTTLINQWERSQENNNFSDYIRNHTLIKSSQVERNCFSLLSQPTKPHSIWDYSGNNRIPTNYEFFTLLVKLAFEIIIMQFMTAKSSETTPNDFLLTGKLFSSWLPLHRHFPKDPNQNDFSMNKRNSKQFPYLTESVIEAEIVDCGRSVFVGEESVVTAELTYLKNNYERRPFQRGSVGYVAHFSGWAFEQPGHSPMPRIFRQFLEGGIHGLLVKYSRISSYFRRKEGTKEIMKRNPNLFSVKSLGLEGSIQTIFILWIALLAISLLAFATEVVTKKYTYYSNNTVLLFFQQRRTFMFSYVP